MTQATPASMEQLLERSKPRNPWRPALAILVVVAVLALIAYVIVQVTSPAPGSRWRTAKVGVYDVSSTITGVASIEPVSEASVAFPVAGTVRTIDVRVGATVQPGQAMATLDPTSFETTLHAKQASLAKANLNLTQALDAQAAAAAATTTTTTAGGGGGGGGGGATPLAQAQARVVAAQRQVDTAITAANTALTGTTQPCAAPSNPQQISTCQSALQRAASAQTAVASAQQNLATATTALDALLNQQAGGSTTTTTPGGGGARPSNTTTTVPSAADIVSLQAQVDAAQAAVTVAEQNLLQTVIVSPIAGTVVSIGLTVGSTVSANSSTSAILVQGPGGFESTMSVSVDQVPNIRINQKATVLPDGSETPISGRVSLIALTPSTATTGTTPTYRVTIALDGRSSALHNGAIGTGAIITATAPNAVAVPTSAIHLSTTGRTVTVLSGSTISEVPIEIGVAGDDRTQVTSGLEIGQQVVLADLDEPLPGTATKSQTNSNTNSNSTNNRVTLPNGQTIQIPAGGTGGNVPGGNFPTGGNAPTRPGG